MIKDPGLDEVIPPEITGDAFYEAIQEIASQESIKTILEIGSSSGNGSTQALFKGLSGKQTKAKLYCLEASKPRFKKLQKRYEKSPFVKCYHASSVPMDRFLTEEEVIDFYNNNITCTNNFSLERVLGLLKRDVDYLKSLNIPQNGIQLIRQENEIDFFDMVLIDGSGFSAQAELNEVFGAKVICLDDANEIKNFSNFKQLEASPEYIPMVINWKLRNGYAIFQRAF